MTETHRRAHAIYGIDTDTRRALCVCGLTVPEADADAHVTAGNAPTPPAGFPAGADLPTLTRTAAGTWLLRLGEDVLELTHGQLDATATALREAFYNGAPTLTRVRGVDDGETVELLEVLTGPLPADPETGRLPDGHLTGLQCPWCNHVAWSGFEDSDTGITVVDTDERWSDFGYTRELRTHYRLDVATGRYTDTGAQTWQESVTGSYADTDYEGLGYRCPACHAPVQLPDGVTEDGS